MSVTDRVNAVAKFRFIEVRLMETAAAWTPTTPQLEVKVMFGRHIWDFARHADALGKRTFELRQAEHYTVAPEPAYVEMLDRMRALEGAEVRLGAAYEAVLPDLARRYREYVATTDPVLDEPSILIMEGILADIDRHRAQAAAVAKEIGIPLLAPPEIVGAVAANA